MDQDTTDTTDTGQAAGPDPLASLAAEAAAIEGGRVEAQAQAVAQAQAQAVATATAEAVELVNLAGSILVPLLPDRYGKCYGPAELARIGEALGAVAAKRGWSLAGTLGAWGPEIALVAACAGPVLPVLIADAKAKRQAESGQAGQGGQAPAEVAQAPAAPAVDAQALAGERVL